MPIIIALYASILALAVWQENHGRDSEKGSGGSAESETRCCG
jgi:hypothetical protein